MSDLYWNTVSSAMRRVLRGFGEKELSGVFYLAGGTALALQIGHRVSVDLDFFSLSGDVPSLAESLRAALKVFSPELVDSSWGNLVFLVEGVRVGFYGYGFPLVAPLLIAEGIKIAGVADIALMKMDALLSRASRKDFHDLYAICQRTSLRELLDLAPQKYANIRDFETQVARHMVYFERAEQESSLPLIETVEWETVKTWFRLRAIELEKSWLE